MSKYPRVPGRRAWLPGARIRARRKAQGGSRKAQGCPRSYPAVPRGCRLRLSSRKAQGCRSPGPGASSIDHERDARRKIIPGPGCPGLAAGSEAISRKAQGFTPVK